MSRYCVELCQKFQVSSVHQLTWYHSCNSKAKLAKALRSDVHLIEADVTLGDYEATEGDAHIGWSSSSVVVGTSPAASSSAPRMQHPAPRRANRRDRGGEGESSALAALGRGLAQAENAENGNSAPAVLQVVDVCTTTTTKAGSCAVDRESTLTTNSSTTAGTAPGASGDHSAHNHGASFDPPDRTDSLSPPFAASPDASGGSDPPLPASSRTRRQKRLYPEGESSGKPGGVESLQSGGARPPRQARVIGAPPTSAAAGAVVPPASAPTSGRRSTTQTQQPQPQKQQASTSDRSTKQQAGAASAGAATSTSSITATKQVIMAHPPSRRSNLTLEQFIRRVCQYNCAVEPDLAKTRQTEVIHNLNQNTTLLEGVAIPITNANGDVSGLLLGPPPGNRSYEDLDPFIREILEESESTASELEKTASDGSLSGSDFLHTPKSSNGSVVGGADHYLVRGTTSKADRRMNAELQEHLGMHTVVKKTKRRPKGIKLDFKDMAAVKPAIDLLMKMNVWAQVVCVWLNADIAAGPGCLPLQDNWVLDGRKFLQRCCRVPDVVLSLGWISSELSPGGRYTQRMVNDMLELVQRPFLRGADSFLYTPAKIAHHITFCVQARYALASTEVLKELLELVPSSSLTVYTGTATFGITPDDLQAIEENFDTTRLFVDVWTRTQKSSKGKIMKSSLGTERCSVM